MFLILVDAVVIIWEGMVYMKLRHAPHLMKIEIVLKQQLFVSFKSVFVIKFLEQRCLACG